MNFNRSSLTILITIVALMTIFSGAASAATSAGSEDRTADRQVSLSGTLRLQDYETFSDNEHAAGNFNHVVTLNGYQPTEFAQIPSPKICAGGEIWAALDMTVTRINEVGDVIVIVEGHLYEGSSCGTTDLDGTYSTRFYVSAGRTAVKQFTIWNTDEDQSEDKADITLTVFNDSAAPSTGSISNPLTRNSECHNAIQGKVAWDYKGSKAWNSTNIERLCKGNERSAEPASCFNQVMHGGINWGGSTQWGWKNALNLCAGSAKADATINCFQQAKGKGHSWQAAINICKGITPDELSSGSDVIPSPSKNKCYDAVQGKIAWNYEGKTNWDSWNIDRLCRGKEHSTQPAICLEKTLHGGINWGGGTLWEWKNALNLCAGSAKADTTISCFQRAIQQNQGWKTAINSCKQITLDAITRRISALNAQVSKATIKGELMTDRCSATTYVTTRYPGPRQPEIDENGILLIRGKRDSNGYTEWSHKIPVNGHKWIRWYCNSTTGNIFDPGTWRISGTFAVGVSCGQSGSGDVSCNPRPVVDNVSLSLPKEWTPERSRCASRKTTAISARLGPNRLLQIQCWQDAG